MAKIESLEQDNINLTVEKESLKRTIENIKNSSSKVVDLEQEKAEMAQKIKHLKKNIESLKSEKSKHEQLEVNMLELDTENQKLQRGVLGLTRKLEHKDKEMHDLENQVQSHQKTIDQNAAGSAQNE